jgi:pimeloyl-ACP methyl ester carboxylesterase
MDDREAGWHGYRFPVRYATLAGCRTAILDEGGGAPPLLFLHGHASSIVEWDSTVSDLRDRFRCVVPDLPGHGMSCLPPAPEATLDRNVRTCLELLDLLAAGPAVVVGHSMGGRVGAHMALRRPDRVRSLVMVNAPADQPLPRSLKRITRFVPLSLVPTLFRSKPLFRRFLRRYSSGMVRDPNPLTRRKAAYFRALRQGADLPARARFLTALGRDLFRDNLHERLHEIRVPVLVVWSDRDPTCPVRSAELITARVPRARLVLMRGCGHNPHLERAGAFQEALLTFVQSLPGVLPPP